VGSLNYIKFINKEEDDIPFIRTSDLVNYEIDSYPDFFISQEIYDKYPQDIEEGDLLISNDGKIGLTAFVTKLDNCIFQSHIRRIRLKDECPISDKYLFAFINSFYGQYQLNKFTLIQSTIPTLSNRLNDLIIPILSEDAIKEIEDIVTKAIKLKQERKKLINDAKSEIEKIFLK
jgi:type I restriction enzyme S subunit